MEYHGRRGENKGVNKGVGLGGESQTNKNEKLLGRIPDRNYLCVLSWRLGEASMGLAWLGLDWGIFTTEDR